MGKEILGTPAMALLPARNYRFKIVKQEHRIVVPRKGVYNEIAPEVFGEDSGEFNLYDEENTVMYLPAISKVLFAVSKYPDLAVNQLFTPIALLINEDDVEIIGQVVEMLPSVDNTTCEI